MATRPKDESETEGAKDAADNGASAKGQREAVDEDLHRYIARHEPTQLEGWLDAVMEELAVPTKRPFDGMV